MSAAGIAWIQSRLPSHKWPDRELKIVAVDAVSGEPLAQAVEELRGGGGEVAIVEPGAASQAAIGPTRWIRPLASGPPRLGAPKAAA